jgi:NAD(P)-dependent dehydrogenase (short-subunit alcohol dehydrogenase family)
LEVAAYGASKAAAGSLTRLLGVEWSKQGVLVNAIGLGIFCIAINANMLDHIERRSVVLTRISMGRFGIAEELSGRPYTLHSMKLRL